MLSRPPEDLLFKCYDAFMDALLGSTMLYVLVQFLSSTIWSFLKARYATFPLPVGYCLPLSSMPILEKDGTGRQFALLILQLLTARNAPNGQPNIKPE